MIISRLPFEQRVISQNCFFCSALSYVDKRRSGKHGSEGFPAGMLFNGYESHCLPNSSRWPREREWPNPKHRLAHGGWNRQRWWNGCPGMVWRGKHCKTTARRNFWKQCHFRMLCGRSRTIDSTMVQGWCAYKETAESSKGRRHSENWRRSANRPLSASLSSTGPDYSFCHIVRQWSILVRGQQSVRFRQQHVWTDCRGRGRPQTYCPFLRGRRRKRRSGWRSELYVHRPQSLASCDSADQTAISEPITGHSRRWRDAGNADDSSDAERNIRKCGNSEIGKCDVWWQRWIHVLGRKQVREFFGFKMASGEGSADPTKTKSYTWKIENLYCLRLDGVYLFSGFD